MLQEEQVAPGSFAPAFFFIDQERHRRSLFQGESDRLAFAGPELFQAHTFNWPFRLFNNDPRRVFRNPGPGLRRRARALQLSKHSLRNQDPPEKLHKNLSFIDEDEIVEWGAVRNNHYPAVNFRDISRSCSRSSSV